MPTVVAEIACPPAACWRALTDVASFSAWMPGLRRAAIISTTPEGLPHEVRFEFSTSLVYSLVYRYDTATHEVHWEPRTGARDAVRGHARIEPHGDGSRLTYHLEQGAGRNTGDLVLGGAHAIVNAFVRWMDGAASARRE